MRSRPAPRCLALALAAALAGPLPATALGPVPPAWEYAQELAVPAPGLVEVSVPPAALDQAQPGLEDLRIVDGAAQKCPTPSSHGRRRLRACRPPAAEVSQTSAEGATVGVYRTGAAGPIDTLTLRTPARDFIKPVTVEASDDRCRLAPLAVRYPSSASPTAPSASRSRRPRRVPATSGSRSATRASGRSRLPA